MLVEHAEQTVADWKPVGKWSPAGQLIGAQLCSQFDQGQRIAMRLSNQLVRHRPSHRVAGTVGQDLNRVIVGKTVEGHRVDPGEMILIRAPVTEGDHDTDPLVL